MRKFSTIALLILAFGIMGQSTRCEGGADRAQRVATDKMQDEAFQQVGMPGITNFTELKFAKNLYELRDQAITTYTYIVDFNGQLHLLCESVGYGLPYSVQYSNPMKRRNGYSMPQPEPNGLFMPPGLDATFVLCKNPNGEGAMPIYSEPKIVVSPFKLRKKDDYKV
jgi:hypothetical protein